MKLPPMSREATVDTVASVYDGLATVEAIRSWAEAGSGLDDAPRALVVLGESLSELAPRIAEASGLGLGTALFSPDNQQRIARLSELLKGLAATRREVASLAEAILAPPSAAGRVSLP